MIDSRPEVAAAALAVLRAARSLLVRAGHAHEPFVADGGMCLGRALALAGGVAEDDGHPGWQRMAGRVAACEHAVVDARLSPAAALARHCVHLAAVELPGYDPQLPCDPDRGEDAPVADNLAGWNDHPDRTVDDVVGLLDLAIARTVTLAAARVGLAA